MPTSVTPISQWITTTWQSCLTEAALDITDWAYLPCDCDFPFGPHNAGIHVTEARVYAEAQLNAEERGDWRWRISTLPELPDGYVF